MHLRSETPKGFARAVFEHMNRLDPIPGRHPDCPKATPECDWPDCVPCFEPGFQPPYTREEHYRELLRVERAATDALRAECRTLERRLNERADPPMADPESWAFNPPDRLGE